MKLIRYDYPALPSARDFDRIFNEFMAAAPRFGGLFENAAGQRIAADLYEDEGNVYARFELPGFRKEELGLQLENSVLTLNVERKGDKEGRSSFSASRSVSLPDGLDAERVSARHEDGVLTVTLPKKPEIKPRSIKIA